MRVLSLHIVGIGTVIKETLKWGQQVVRPSFSRTDPSKYAEPGPDMFLGIGSLSSNDHSSNANVQSVVGWAYISSPKTICGDIFRISGEPQKPQSAGNQLFWRGRKVVSVSFQRQSRDSRRFLLLYLQSQRTKYQEEEFKSDLNEEQTNHLPRNSSWHLCGHRRLPKHTEYSKYSSTAAVTIKLPEREMIKYVLTQLGMHVINLTG